MNRTKWSILKFALLLGTLSVLLTGCFIWRGHDDDHHDDQDHQDDHHDDDHHDDQDHH